MKSLLFKAQTIVGSNEEAEKLLHFEQWLNKKVATEAAEEFGIYPRFHLEAHDSVVDHDRIP